MMPLIKYSVVVGTVLMLSGFSDTARAELKVPAGYQSSCGKVPVAWQVVNGGYNAQHWIDQCVNNLMFDELRVVWDMLLNAGYKERELEFYLQRADSVQESLDYFKIMASMALGMMRPEVDIIIREKLNHP